MPRYIVRYEVEAESVEEALNAADFENLVIDLVGRCACALVGHTHTHEDHEAGRV